ncbi:hypothetical protein ACFX19_040606 [Malus domestica]
MICAALVRIDYIKDKAKDLSQAESATFMESCTVLDHNLSDVISLEDITTCIRTDSRKGPMKSLDLATSSQYCLVMQTTMPQFLCTV